MRFTVMPDFNCQQHDQEITEPEWYHVIQAQLQ